LNRLFLRTYFGKFEEEQNEKLKEITSLTSTAAIINTMNTAFTFFLKNYQTKTRQNQTKQTSTL
jgi:hypothetical protein